MADVMKMPEDSFGYVPTPALVAPIEFTLPLANYEQLGGHVERIQSVESVITPEVRRFVAGEGRAAAVRPAPGLQPH